MKKAPLLIALLFSLFCISSCKKIPVLPENNSKAIIGKQWKMTGYTENGVDKLTELYEPCELDDISIYKANGRVDVDDRSTVCDYDIEIKPDVVKWEISDKKLFLSYEFVDPESNFTIEFEILELSAKKLTYALKIPVDPDDTEDTDGPEVWTYTFTAQ
jgi:hypothetical protein